MAVNSYTNKNIIIRNSNPMILDALFSFIHTTKKKHTQHWAEIMLHDQENAERHKR